MVINLIAVLLQVPDTLLGIVEKLTNDLDIRFTFTMADEPRGRDQAEPQLRQPNSFDRIDGGRYSVSDSIRF